MSANEITDPVGRFLATISRIMAVMGSLIIVGLATMLVITIFARKLLDWQVTGDHELVRMGGAVAVSLMLPWCTMTSGHVVVDLFTSGLPTPVRNLLDRLGAMVLAIMFGVLAWRTGVLVTESIESRSFSPMLAWPVWIFQASMVIGLFVSGAIALYFSFAPDAGLARAKMIGGEGELE